MYRYLLGIILLLSACTSERPIRRTELTEKEQLIFMCATATTVQLREWCDNKEGK